MIRAVPLLLSPVAAIVTAAQAAGAADAVAEYDHGIRPLLTEYCLKCHSTEKQKGELDLERFRSIDDVKRAPEVWQEALEQLSDGEMPPKDKPQLSAEQKQQLMAWIGTTLETIGRENAGDPGPVVLRRLSNAEYTYTIRDLTGIESLDPAREFPVDGAAGEGFTNAGAALVMSPALLTKYLDAAKEIAGHAVLLPDGVQFSEKTTPRDWTEEKLAAIRGFYAGFSETGGAQPVNLQGIQFDTNAGGRLPLEKYLAATLTERDGLLSGSKSIAAVTAERGLNAKYLGTLWAVLTGGEPSLLFDMIRAQWRAAKPDGAPAVAAAIGQWQKALWRFTTVGHIGKRDGPKAWQVPVVPLAPRQEIRMKLPAPAHGKDVTLYLSVSDAGDGREHDFAVWENPRLVAPGRPDLALRDVRETVRTLTEQRGEIMAAAAKCLAAAAEAGASPDKSAVGELARKHGVAAPVLAAWLDYLGIGSGAVRIDAHMKQRMERAENYDFVKGWTGADALSVVANSSGQHVRIPGNMKPHGVAVHPSPKLRVAVGWRSPVAGAVQVSGRVQHAHPECGNGVTWLLELRRGNTRQRLAAGTAQGAELKTAGPVENLTVQEGDFISLVIGPRDGNHSCDLTAVDLTITADGREWDLAKDVSRNILAGNPHADRQGHDGVWHFYSEPDNGGGPESLIPAGSLLAKWRSASAAKKPQIADDIQKLLQSGAADLPKDSPDAALFRQLASLNGPLLRSVAGRMPAPAGKPLALPDGSAFGPDPALFGKHPDGSGVAAAGLSVQAPSVVEVRLPADLAEGCEFVATGSLHRESGAEGSVQFGVTTTKPATSPGLAAGAAKPQGGKGTWSDGEQPLGFDTPVVVNDGSAARRRMEAAFDDFRSLFPIALCYTKIVPVDEVVTLTLFYREDEALQRLMLDDVQRASLDRLWDEMHFVSQDALALVDAFEQLWQYATQDADPSAFTPMREPIKQRAAEFRKLLADTAPRHVQAVLDMAPRAWRRPLSEAELVELRGLYQKLRAQELPHDAAVRMLLARVLVAPAFLYRGEKAAPGSAAAPVNDWELATRLSYFLWSSAPDDELRGIAAAGQLREPDVLAAQARRMLKDPRVRRLATEFACQWLHVRDLETLDEKSERHFPTFASVRGAMQEEAVRFFTDFFRRDASVLSLLDADHTFVNARLAAHYGLTPDPRLLIPESGWQRVDGIRAKGRGGILGFAATLAKQSGASRTSPILRGNWFCETLLGERLPRPPKGVPVLPEEPPAGLTERQLIEKHSSDPACARCHERIDPFGYALEGFDAIGRSRDANTRAHLADGTVFNGLDGLRTYLLTTRRDDFVRQFCRKLLGYALGRSVMLSDRPLLEEVQARLAASGFHVADAVELIVTCRQFREVRGRTEVTR
jgi:Protein of unknown function (DUF1592)/Protein of unknown function (DUF1588)/Protein of unknown function (DUF1587)/Protein of unknown function (DUF1585)/Protein of unknown function (DUF1595)/Planctomycete cytochrome C